MCNLCEDDDGMISVLLEAFVQLRELGRRLRTRKEKIQISNISEAKREKIKTKPLTRTLSLLPPSLLLQPAYLASNHPFSRIRREQNDITVPVTLESIESTGM